MKLTLAARIQGGFILSSMLMVVVSYVGYHSNGKVVTGSASQREITERHALAQTLLLHLEQQDNTRRAFLLTADWPWLAQTYLADYEKAKQDFEEKRTQLTKFAWTGEGKDIVVRLAELHRRYNEIAQNEIDLARGKQRDEARALNVAGTNLSQTAFRDLLHRLEATLQQQQDQAAREESSMSHGAAQLLIVISLFAIVTSLVLGMLITRSIATGLGRVNGLMKEAADGVAGGDGDLTKRLPITTNDEIGTLSTSVNMFLDKLHEIIQRVAESTHQLASASEEISASANQMAHGAKSQQSQTSQVATAIQEMSTSAGGISADSTKATDSALRAAEIAKEGGKIVNEALADMREIAESVNTTTQEIEELGKHSDQIGKIVAVIREIADQTRLLALNAAIEAARAGQQGRGFAVVADEVGKLAERTSQATQDIAQMIDTVQKGTKAAVGRMQAGTKQVEAGLATTSKAGASLAGIITAAQQVGEKVSQIATAATQQSSTAEQINSNVEQIAKTTRESAEGAQQSARACEELSHLALDLQQLVGRFRLDDANTTGGTDATILAGQRSSGWARTASALLAGQTND
jgi:methyl-accepting chemotaxis protein